MGAALAAGAVGLNAYQGYQQQKKIKKAQKGQKSDLLNLQGQMMDTLNSGLGEQEGYLKKSLKASQEGFSSALADADRLEVAGNKGAQSFFDQASKAATGNAASRGLLGSSGAANMQLGAARGATRAMTDAQLAASRLRTSAQLGLGAAKAQGFNALGNFSAYRANARNHILSGLWDHVAGQQFTAQAPQGANLAELALLLGNSGEGGGGSSGYTSSLGNTGHTNPNQSWHQLFGGS